MTLRNAREMDYPFEQSISSMMTFCDEVCVLDSSDKQDGTWEKLTELQTRYPGVLKIHHENINWSAPNHGIFDGQTKQLAREMCRGQYLWQCDSDEIVHEDHAPLIRPLIEQIGAQFQKVPVLALPVVEYWGGTGKVRIDVNPWKWRVTLNIKDIVHGIPSELRWNDPLSGLDYARPGTDTCDYISRATGERYPCIFFIPPEVDKARVNAIRSNPASEENLKGFEVWFNSTLQQLPGVFHYSWFSIERKILQYQMFWTGFWKAMYNENRDERQNPFFPGLLWSEVTDEMIKEKALILEANTGGHIFHTPWDGSKTNSIRVFKNHPAVMDEWINSHK